MSTLRVVDRDESLCRELKRKVVGIFSVLN